MSIEELTETEELMDTEEKKGRYINDGYSAFIQELRGRMRPSENVVEFGFALSPWEYDEILKRLGGPDAPGGKFTQYADWFLATLAEDYIFDVAGLMDSTESDLAKTHLGVSSYRGLKFLSDRPGNIIWVFNAWDGVTKKAKEYALSGDSEEKGFARGFPEGDYRTVAVRVTDDDWTRLVSILSDYNLYLRWGYSEMEDGSTYRETCEKELLALLSYISRNYILDLFGLESGNGGAARDTARMYFLMKGGLDGANYRFYEGVLPDLNIGEFVDSLDFEPRPEYANNIKMSMFPNEVDRYRRKLGLPERSEENAFPEDPLC